MWLFWITVAILGAAIHLWRVRSGPDAARTAAILLAWWMGVAIGLDAIVSGLFHVFDPAETASKIGFTNGDGGFQMEVGAADVSIGLLAVLAAFFPRRFMLAALVVVAVSHFGDAAVHIYQRAHNDNTDPDNVGVVLYYAILAPLIAIALYAWYERSGGNSRGAVR